MLLLRVVVHAESWECWEVQGNTSSSRCNLVILSACERGRFGAEAGAAFAPPRFAARFLVLLAGR